MTLPLSKFRPHFWFAPSPLSTKIFTDENINQGIYCTKILELLGRIVNRFLCMSNLKEDRFLQSTLNLSLWVSLASSSMTTHPWNKWNKFGDLVKFKIVRFGFIIYKRLIELLFYFWKNNVFKYKIKFSNCKFLDNCFKSAIFLLFLLIHPSSEW